MVKSNMWLWANDEKIVEKFNSLKISEIIFFTLFLLLFSTKYFWLQLPVYFYSVPYGVTERVNELLPYFWFAILAILLVSRHDLLRAVFSWSSISCRIFLEVDKKVYLFFLFSVFLAIAVIFVYPDSWIGISKSIKNMVSMATIIKSVFGVAKEELLYRFILYYSLHRFLGRNAAFFVTVILFSLTHSSNSVYYPFAVAPAGILFSIFAIATGSVLSSFLLHLIFNIIVYIFAINFL